ncbi:surfeit locus protein 6 homolog isoform X2 [Centruroides vittatus]|uniref:surfeit locus protein 6 homolog isoform X2 n=1 Tax=Centruroides vittatus TaxID=120091 RepID=UPI00350FE5F8
MNLKLEEELQSNTNKVDQTFEDDDRYFQELIDLIPPKFYFDQEIIDTLTTKKHKITNEKIKGLKRKKSEKGKNAIARLDPYQHKTVSEIQEELAKEEEKSKKSKFPATSQDRSSNLQELQERLRTKIASLSAKRKGTSTNEATVEQKQWKRKMSKLKNNKSAKRIKLNNNNNKDSIAFPTNTDEKKMESNKPIYNKDKKMVFSKFDFPETEKKASKHSGKNYKKLLKKTLKEKEELKTMEINDPEKAFVQKEKKNWLKAIDKAGGIKVKDNPELLKKSIKKQEQMKRKSQKKWKERKETVEKFKQKKEQKRRENIKAKKQEKINKKIKRAKKKGRILPGF